MKTLSLEVSKKLLKMEIEGDCEIVWHTGQLWNHTNLEKHYKDKCVNAYNLQETIDILPQLYKAMKFDQPIWHCNEYKITPVGSKYPICIDDYCPSAGYKGLEEIAEFILEAYLQGGMSSVDTYLLELLDK